MNTTEKIINIIEQYAERVPFDTGEELRINAEELPALKKEIDIIVRLEQLREVIRNENLSYAELAALQNLAPYIDPTDTQLLEAAGVEENTCPHCEKPLTSKMFDVDGTNLVEANTCEACGYGTPALT